MSSYRSIGGEFWKETDREKRDPFGTTRFQFVFLLSLSHSFFFCNLALFLLSLNFDLALHLVSSKGSSRS